jgi:hypothetical protein
MTKPTPKERVLAKWPTAKRFKLNGWIDFPRVQVIYIKSGRQIGYGQTPRQAWADAARRLTKGR